LTKILRRAQWPVKCHEPVGAPTTCMIAQTYEKLGDKGMAAEYYRKALAATFHNPPAAYAVPFARKKLSQSVGS